MGVSKRFFIVVLAAFNSFLCYSQDTLTIKNSSEIIDLSPFLSLNDDSSTNIQTIKRKAFTPLATTSLNADLPIQWLKFIIYNADSITHEINISASFMDKISFYSFNGSAYTFFKNGDLTPLYDRKTTVGQLCFMPVLVPSHQSRTCYLRLESVSPISQQFRTFSIKSLKAYPEEGFNFRFQQSRIYQAFFYGAILIMLFYNLFLFFNIRSKSYLIYVVFLFSLIVFLASNNGYIVELIIPDYPRIDLYIRFLSTPLLLLSFLLFTKYYLHTNRNAPTANTILLILSLMCILIPIGMLLGYWYSGRNLIILISLLSFIFILLLGFYILKIGYKPARYFIIANILLIIGAIFFALERLSVVSHNPFTQYSVQLSVIFQSIFFSIGLSDRIRRIQQQLSNSIIENEKLERISQLEKQKIIEDKNKELLQSNLELDTFIYRTAHDIRGPLARVMGLCNVGLVDVTDTKAKEYLEMLKQNADYLNYILSRLSTAYEIKNIYVEPTNVNISNLIKDVITAIQFHEEIKNTEIQIDCNSDLDITTDYKLLRFVLINLIENGLKFRKKDRFTVSFINIKVECVSSDLIIYISDNGIGISDEYIPYLFDMFSKAAGEFHTPGLGLYMTSLCIKKMKGNIQLIQPRELTTFKVTIPISINTE